MNVLTIPVGPLQTNCYLAWDPETNRGFLVDPGDDASRILLEVARHHVAVECILLTHCHFDHVMALHTVRTKLGAPAAIHQLDSYGLGEEAHAMCRMFLGGNTDYQPDTAQKLLQDGDVLSLAGAHILVIHTPGHTQGSCCFDTGTVLFSGDTLFNGDCGRCDLPGGSVDSMMSSLRRLAALDGDRILYPGHAEASTLDAQRRENLDMRHAVYLGG